jgi:TonB family protein
VNGKPSPAPAGAPVGQKDPSRAQRNQTVVCGLNDRLKISIENVSFVLRFVRPQPGIKIRVLEDSDWGFFKIAAVCAAACIALIAGLLVSSKPVSRFETNGASAPTQYARLLIRPEPKPHPIKQVGGLPEGAKAKEEEGKFGVPKAKQEQADPSRPGSPIVEPRKREDDRKKVMTAGLLGAWGKSPDASNVLGPGGLGTGINNAIGGLKPGAGLVDARGVGGLGSRGGGVGGGGTALGLGGLGTRGEGRGVGGSGLIDLSGRGKDTTRVVPGKTIVVGGLSKEVIAKIIRSHQSEIKYCYEIELQKKPSLFGKVAVLFTIDGSGSVSEANVAETSLDNSNTEQCMLGRIRRWRFPEPQGGGLVTVTFPWVFKPAGGEES